MSWNRAEPSSLSPVQRCWLGLASAGILVGFALAAAVQPDPRGYGTHQQFGFPPCSLREVFGIPCPSCGGTTCVAHFVRGQWPSALKANVAIFGLAAACAAFVPWSWACIWRGRLLFIHAPLPVLTWTVITLAALASVQWLVRIAIT
jgi:hypothetical protein